MRLELTDALAALFGGFLLSEVKTAISAWFRRRTTERDSAILAYRTLLRIRVTLIQIMVSRFEAMIFFAFHERRWQLGRNPTDFGSLDFKEAQRWQQKSEDGVREITEQLAILFETCATLSLYFGKDKYIQSLIDEMYKYKTIQISTSEFTAAPASRLDKMRDDAVEQVQDLAKEHYGKPIDKLAKAVRMKLFR